jgi:hypothetical protein
MMPIRRQKLQFLAALTTLLLLAVGVGCKGFFVNSPDSVTISPDPITFSEVGDTQQLTAQATFGTQSQDVTTSTNWQSSNGCAVVASTTTKGLMTVISTGASVTISATYNGVTDTVSATTPSGIKITPCGSQGRFGIFNSGDSLPLTATSGSDDVTSSTTFTSSNTSIVRFTGNTATFGGTTGTATITAHNGSDTDGKLLVTVQ